ncbi:conserved hypothetical protein [Theileria equi strain WA]|uniref:Ubiquitin-related modifier 1 homolog n=1 Tax=Theileria equi strain WA TaxID=1537102 RepID=L1LE55_THEEQ|nr:conserved hypothetical protein [Theileria equi strain WA]EKX73564.1 conserved hypothetical protein [Theileria equi strain WA]|eukprot:XP_004833016.1 conserved hypothetical protein [Theileria equi strain WA]
MSNSGAGGQHLDITVEFSGGLESLTLEQTKELNLKIYTPKVDVGQLIAYIRRTVIGAKKDLFSFGPEASLSEQVRPDSLEAGGNSISTRVKVECKDSHFSGELNLNESCKIRPGILVLVNDIDWELLGTESCIIENKQRITFISTLHGG